MPLVSSTGARVGVLAGVALLALALALVFSPLFRHKAKPASAPWYTALAAPYAPSGGSAKTACGRVIGAATIGVAHPVLPCGAKLEISFGGKHVVARVIDRAPSVPGHTFDLTRALARLLGVHGTQRIEWRFAG
ncbi:MAG TPA: RlpA-like double-psi beta-barrel domain-containing protein [Gaiellaceae bacterium]|nr:RlpA-like double-psi beta-barrel domain-containing protein [Gaiellaceae bacterium]